MQTYSIKWYVSDATSADIPEYVQREVTDTLLRNFEELEKKSFLLGHEAWGDIQERDKYSWKTDLWTRAKPQISHAIDNCQRRMRFARGAEVRNKIDLLMLRAGDGMRRLDQ